MSKKSENSGVPFNPFKGKDPNEVWRAILSGPRAEPSTPSLSREEVMRRFKEQSQRAKKGSPEK